MNKALFPEREKERYYVRFNIDGLMRGSYKERMTANRSTSCATSSRSLRS